MASFDTSFKSSIAALRVAPQAAAAANAKSLVPAGTQPYTPPTSSNGNKSGSDVGSDALVKTQVGPVEDWEGNYRCVLIFTASPLPVSSRSDAKLCLPC